MNGSIPTAMGTPLLTDKQGYMAFSPDGKLLAVGAFEGQLQLFETTTWTVVASLTGHASTDNINGVGFSSDGKHLYAVDDGDVLTDHLISATPTLNWSV